MDQPVLVAGSINMDLVIKVPQAPRPGENVFGDGLQAIPRPLWPNSGDKS